jgi:hypothetical protein
MHHDLRANERSLSSLIIEVRDVIKSFAATRLQILRLELKERGGTLMVAVALSAAGAVLVGTSYLICTFALVALVAAFFRSTPFAWFYASGMVALLYLFVGGSAIYLALRELKSKPWAPKTTLEIMKGDILWMKAESKGRT